LLDGLLWVLKLHYELLGVLLMTLIGPGGLNCTDLGDTSFVTLADLAADGAAGNMYDVNMSVALSTCGRMIDRLRSELVALIFPYG
jgi:hypothetical protein